jgi:hypothetical protein
MCEPLALVAAAGSIAAAGVNYMGQQATLDAQRKANEDWVAYQRAASQKAAAADEAARQQADAARQETLTQVNPQAQEKTQQDQAQNLTGAFTSGTAAQTGADPNTALLSGSTGAGADQNLTKDMAANVTNAAKEARSRIAALANLSAYGGGYGGAANVAGTAITQGNQDIALTGDIRQGIAKTLGVSQAVQPEQFVQGSNIAGSIAGSLANLAGSAFGRSMKGA